jgi:hypothetical protein
VIDALDAIDRAHFKLGLGGGNALAARTAFAAAARTAEHFERPVHRKLTGRKLRLDSGGKVAIGEVVNHGHGS